MVQLLMVHRAAIILAGFAALAGACSSPSASSALSQDRISALTRLGNEGKPSDVPSVLPSLSSDDPLVRWTAQRALMQIAGTNNGYDWAGSRPDRERAIQTWVAWCRDRGVAPSAEEAHGG
jgi:HEAT repeat protein